MITLWDLDGRLLRYFLAVVTEGSIRGAADKLNVAASAISRQISDLEIRCGLPLLERKPRGVVATEAGLALAEHAKQQIEDSERFLDYLRQLQGLRNGAIKICCGEGFSGDLMENAVLPFLDENPGVRFDINQAGTAEIVDAVAQSRVDIGLAYDPPRMTGVRSITLARQPLHAILPPLHRLATRSSVSLADFNEEPLALLNDTHGIRTLLRRVEADNGRHLIPSVECATLDMVRRFALCGHGATFLPVFAVSREVESCELAAVPLADPYVEQASAHLIVRAQRRLPRDIERLLALISIKVRAFQPS